MTATASKSKKPSQKDAATKPAMGRSRKEVDTSTYTGRFAVRLRTLREKANLTVEELAEKSGIPEKTIYSWESADRTAGVDQLPILAKAIGVKTATLLPKDE